MTRNQCNALALNTWPDPSGTGQPLVSPFEVPSRASAFAIREYDCNCSIAGDCCASSCRINLISAGLARRAGSNECRGGDRELNTFERERASPHAVHMSLQPASRHFNGHGGGGLPIPCQSGWWCVRARPVHGVQWEAGLPLGEPAQPLLLTHLIPYVLLKSQASFQ